MTTGTRSYLIGTSSPLIRAPFLAWAWAKLYSFPLDPRLWLCFFLLHLGFLGTSNTELDRIDRCWRGARLASWLLDGCRGEFSSYSSPAFTMLAHNKKRFIRSRYRNLPWGWLGPWGRLILASSPEVAEHYHLKVSKMRDASLLSLALMPWRLMKFLALWSGEHREWEAVMLRGPLSFTLDTPVQVIYNWRQICREQFKNLLEGEL